MMRTQLEWTAWLLILVIGVASAAPTPPSSAAKSGGRDDRGTLEAINIEGNLELPQVLFITSRDQIRYRDHLHRKYQKDFVAVAREAKLPRRLTSSQEEK